LADDDGSVLAKLAEIKAYVPTSGIPAGPLLKMAKFALVVQRWIDEQNLVATAVQCWTSLEELFGIVPCTAMSMLSNSLMPSACETDITGAIGMYAMQLASGKPSALLDWNNNYGTDPDKGVVFHCSNLPKAFFSEADMGYQAIIAGTVGQENTYGTMEGRIRPGPFTFCRVSTDDLRGVVRAYIGEGEFTEDPVATYGGYGVIHIPGFQDLLHHICDNGYEHHVALNLSECAAAVSEAFSTYLGWDVYYHNA
jgi:L-fucose isomerase-like protein